MEITYKEYPTILYTSFDKDNAPPELPFELHDESVQNYLSGCLGFLELFSLISLKNSINGDNSNTYYLLDNKMFNLINADEKFRNRYFSYIFSKYIKPRHGVILFSEGGQYVYLFLDEKETKQLKNKNGRYFAVALIKNELFIGFEEGYITPQGVSVDPGGYYENGMAIGGYISFVMVTLSYAEDKTWDTIQTKVSETIYKLK